MIAVRTSPRRTFGPRLAGRWGGPPAKPRMSWSHDGGPPGPRRLPLPPYQVWLQLPVLRLALALVSGSSAPGHWCPMVSPSE